MLFHNYKCYNNDDDLYKDCVFSNIKFKELKENNEKKIKKFNSNFLKKSISLYGFVEQNKNKKIAEFKMAHLDKIKNENFKIIGSACVKTSTFTKKLMIEYITNLDNTISLSIIKNLKKEQLCKLYEYVLRKNNIHFLRPLYLNYL